MKKRLESPIFMISYTNNETRKVVFGTPLEMVNPLTMRRVRPSSIHGLVTPNQFLYDPTFKLNGQARKLTGIELKAIDSNRRRSIINTDSVEEAQPTSEQSA